MSIRALGGGELKGNKLVRFAYLDESGTGDPAKEPYVVVAGVLVHADKQWKALERYISDMADDFALPDDRPGFVFHASELINGGKIVTREKYPLEKRHQALQDLCEIPAKFNFLVVVAGWERKNFVSVDQALVAASGACAHIVEDYMCRHADPDEVATMVYEQNGKYSKSIRAYHNHLRSAAIEQYVESTPGTQIKRLERVVETAMFVEKNDTSALQVADACAYILGRRMRRVAGDERFYQPLMPQIMRAPSHLFADLRMVSS